MLVRKHAWMCYLRDRRNEKTAASVKQGRRFEKNDTRQSTFAIAFATLPILPELSAATQIRPVSTA